MSWIKMLKSNLVWNTYLNIVLTFSVQWVLHLRQNSVPMRNVTRFSVYVWTHILYLCPSPMLTKCQYRNLGHKNIRSLGVIIKGKKKKTHERKKANVAQSNVWRPTSEGKQSHLFWRTVPRICLMHLPTSSIIKYMGDGDGTTKQHRSRTS